MRSVTTQPLALLMAGFLSACGAAVDSPGPSDPNGAAPKPVVDQRPGEHPVTAKTAIQILQDYAAGKSTCSTGIKIREAESICRSRGLRLPTPRELAEYAVTLGARGIRETAYPNTDINEPPVKAERQRMQAEGYAPVLAVIGRTPGWTIDGVEFYFSARDYRIPGHRRGREWYWSSNLYDTAAGMKPYGLRGDSGLLDMLYTSYVGYASATMCCVPELASPGQ